MRPPEVSSTGSGGSELVVLFRPDDPYDPTTRQLANYYVSSLTAQGFSRNYGTSGTGYNFVIEHASRSNSGTYYVFDQRVCLRTSGPQTAMDDESGSSSLS
jgi:hypothetical protein